MTQSNQFNPFTDRKSRDIRNTLSSSLVDCLKSGSIQPAHDAAEIFLNEKLDEQYHTYITNRLSNYSQAVDKIRGGEEDPFWRSLVLWDLELFFEMHEVLEHAWYHSEGDTKLIMQALIRAAGAYIKMEYGYLPQAKRLAGKALIVLEHQKDFLSTYFAPELLIQALQALPSLPPKLLKK